VQWWEYIIVVARAIYVYLITCHPANKVGITWDRAHVSSQQITVEPEPEPPNRVAATSTLSPLEEEVDCMVVMLEKLVAVLARSNPTEPTQGPLRPKVEAPRPAALHWECGNHGHLRTQCPQSGKGLNSYGLQMPPKPAGRKWRILEAETASRPYGHRVTPLTSGKHPVRPVDQCGDRTGLPCHSLTALTAYPR